MIVNVIPEISCYEAGPQCGKRGFPDKVNIHHQCSCQKVLTQCAKAVSVSNNPLISYKIQLLYVKYLLIPGKNGLRFLKYATPKFICHAINSKLPPWEINIRKHV